MNNTRKNERSRDNAAESLTFLSMMVFSTMISNSARTLEFLSVGLSRDAEEMRDEFSDVLRGRLNALDSVEERGSVIDAKLRDDVMSLYTAAGGDTNTPAANELSSIPILLDRVSERAAHVSDLTDEVLKKVESLKKRHSILHGVVTIFRDTEFVTRAEADVVEIRNYSEAVDRIFRATASRIDDLPESESELAASLTEAISRQRLNAYAMTEVAISQLNSAFPLIERLVEFIDNFSPDGNRRVRPLSSFSEEDYNRLEESRLILTEARERSEAKTEE